MSVSELVSFSAENEKYSFGRSLPTITDFFTTVKCSWCFHLFYEEISCITERI